MFKGCCFGSGARGLKDSPELSDNRRLKGFQDVVKGGSKDTSNGADTKEEGCGKEPLEPTKEDKVVDSQIVGTLQGCSAENTSPTTTANFTRVVVAGVNSSAQLPKDKDDSNGISFFIPLKLHSILVKFNRQTNLQNSAEGRMWIVVW